MGGCASVNVEAGLLDPPANMEYKGVRVYSEPLGHSTVPIFPQCDFISHVHTKKEASRSKLMYPVSGGEQGGPGGPGAGGGGGTEGLRRVQDVDAGVPAPRLPAARQGRVT